MDDVIDPEDVRSRVIKDLQDYFAIKSPSCPIKNVLIYHFQPARVDMQPLVSATPDVCARRVSVLSAQKGSMLA